MSCSRIFHLYGDVTITGEGLQNLGLCSALRAFEQGGIFIVSHLLWHGTSVFPVSSEGPPHSVASYDTQGDMENLFLPRSYLYNDSVNTYFFFMKRIIRAFNHSFTIELNNDISLDEITNIVLHSKSKSAWVWWNAIVF
jgi:hypothetical protein